MDFRGYKPYCVTEWFTANKSFLCCQIRDKDKKVMMTIGKESDAKPGETHYLTSAKGFCWLGNGTFLFRVYMRCIGV